MRPQLSPASIWMFTASLIASAALVGPALAADSDLFGIHRPQVIRVLPGEAAGDFCGNAIAAGDLDGDGAQDLFVAACGSDAHGIETGRVYVHRGSLKGPDPTPMLVMTGELAGDIFGFALAVGDLNGDGKADLAVGAPQNDAAGAEAGRVYVFWGGLGADATPDLTLTGDAAGDRFGIALACGDVDGDGDDDLIVGACGSDAAGADAGRALVYHGGFGMNGVADVLWDGLAAGDRFGGSVAALGDISGDGRCDVAIGADGADGAGEEFADIGAVRVFVQASIAVTLWGDEPDAGFGMALAGAGDLNGDGFADIIVGAAGHSAGGLGAGRASVFLGGSNLDDVADFVVDGEPGDRLGAAVGAIGDVDADGKADVATGAPDATRGGIEGGCVRVLFGDAAAPGTRTLEITGRQSGIDFGCSVVGTGDGLIAIGAWYADEIGNDAGRVNTFRLMLPPTRRAGRGRVSGDEPTPNAIVASSGPTRIVDAAGRVVQRIEAGQDGAAILRRLPAGMYFVVAERRTGAPVRRVLVR